MMPVSDFSSSPLLSAMASYFLERNFEVLDDEHVCITFRRLAIERGWLYREAGPRRRGRRRPWKKTADYRPEYLLFSAAVLEEADQQLQDFPSKLEAAQHLIEVYGVNQEDAPTVTEHPTRSI
jgi:hypothetical protein